MIRKLLTTFFIIALVTTHALAQNKIVINASRAKDTINKNIYGHFAEHLGHCIYGGFYVGDGNQAIPNKDGVRLDVIEALKKLKIPVLRWPGGCFADTYHWRDGIGPRKDRPSMGHVHRGGTVENNHGAPRDALDAAVRAAVRGGPAGREYTTVPAQSPRAGLGGKNGRDKPWAIKYWAVGNEN